MITVKIRGKATHTIIHGDSREVVPPTEVGCLVLDPNWERWAEVEGMRLPAARSTLAFTSPEYVGDTIRALGSPTHLFAWDCMAAQSYSQRRPMRRLKLCLWYGAPYDFCPEGSRYNIDPRSNAPKGKRLQELFHEKGFSISEVVERRGHSYAKPLPWVQALIGAVTRIGSVYDPFAGSGTTMFAADALGIQSTLIESDRECIDSSLVEARGRGMTVIG